MLREHVEDLKEAYNCPNVQSDSMCRAKSFVWLEDIWLESARLLSTYALSGHTCVCPIRSYESARLLSTYALNDTRTYHSGTYDSGKQGSTKLSPVHQSLPLESITQEKNQRWACVWKYERLSHVAAKCGVFFFNATFFCLPECYDSWARVRPLNSESERHITTEHLRDLGRP